MGDQVAVNSVPLRRQGTIRIVGHCARDDVKAPGKQGLIKPRIPLDPICSEHPGFAVGEGFGRDDSRESLDLGQLDLKQP